MDRSYDLDRALQFYQANLGVINTVSSTRSQALGELNTAIGLQRADLEERRGLFEDCENFGANERVYIHVTGEVTNQTRFVMSYNVQVILVDVLYDGDGFPTTSGDAKQIEVLRASESGCLTAWNLDANNAANFAIATRMNLVPNDVIFVEEQIITKWSRALAQLFPTLINLGSQTLVP